MLMKSRNYLTDVIYFFNLEQHGHLLAPDFIEKINTFNLSKYMDINNGKLDVQGEEVDKYSLYSFPRLFSKCKKENKPIPDVFLSEYVFPVYDENDNLKGLGITISQPILNNPIFELMQGNNKTFNCLDIYAPVYPHSGWIIKNNNELKSVQYDDVKMDFIKWAKSKNLPNWEQHFFKQYMQLPHIQDSVFISVPLYVMAFFFIAKLFKSPELTPSNIEFETICQPKTIFGFIDNVPCQLIERLIKD